MLPLVDLHTYLLSNVYLVNIGADGGMWDCDPCKSNLILRCKISLPREEFKQCVFGSSMNIRNSPLICHLNINQTCNASKIKPALNHLTENALTVDDIQSVWTMHFSHVRSLQKKHNYLRHRQLNDFLSKKKSKRHLCLF